MEQNDYIVTRDLSLKTRHLSAYNNINLQLPQGRAIGLLAENKTGKTELLLTLAGHMQPSHGTGRVAGFSLNSKRELARLRKISALGFFEHVNEVQPVLPVRTVVSAELNLAARPSGAEATRAYLKEWQLLGISRKHLEELDRYTYDYLGIVLALAKNPQILVVDEIETDLTREQSLKLIELLCSLAEQRNLSVLCGMCDYELASHFDELACLTEAARSWKQKAKESYSL